MIWQDKSDVSESMEAKQAVEEQTPVWRRNKVAVIPSNSEEPT